MRQDVVISEKNVLASIYNIYIYIYLYFNEIPNYLQTSGMNITLLQLKSNIYPIKFFQ